MSLKNSTKNLVKKSSSILYIAAFLLSNTIPYTAQVLAAPSTDYIVPIDITMNEDNGASFDLKDLLGSAYTDGGLLPDYLSADIGYCEATDNTAENECTTAETFTIPADTTAIRITAFGSNSDAANDNNDDDFILINTTVDLDSKSSTFETYSGSLSFPFQTTNHRAYAWNAVDLGAASNSDSPIGQNTGGDSLTVDVSGSTLSVTQTQTLVNTAYLVEYLSSVSNSSLLRGIESIVLDGGAAPGVGVTSGSVDIPAGTDYIVITESGGKPSGDFRTEAKILSRMIMEFQPSRAAYSKVTGLVTNLEGRGPNQTVTYGFDDLDVFGPTTDGILGVGSEASTIGDITASSGLSHSPDVYVSGGDLFIERLFDTANSAGSNFISQYSVEFYERAEQASAAMFLGASSDTIDLNNNEDSRVTCDPATAADNCLDLDIPSGASLGLLNVVAFNRTSASDDNENWGTMSAIIEIDKEVSPSVFEDKYSGTWVNTRASNPDTVAWSNLDLGTRLFNEATGLPETGVTSNKADFASLTDGFPGSTNFRRIDVSGQDTLRIDMVQKNVGGSNSFGANIFIASVQWFGPEPILFGNAPAEFEFSSPALNLGGGNWQLGANAIINGTINIDPPAGYNNNGSVTDSLTVARATDPGNTANININVIPVTDLLTLDDMDPNDTDPPGNTISEILATSNSSPTKTNSGVAVTGFNINTGTGVWEYSIDGGANWNPLAGVSQFNALLLGPNDMLRAVPAGESMTGDVTFLSWDESRYSAGDFQNPTVQAGDDFTLFGTNSDTATIRTVSAPGATEANLLVWYKADDGPNTAVDGGTITRWVDVGTGGNDGFGLIGQEPIFQAFDPNNNYQPTALFNNAGMETLASDLIGDDDPYTKIAIINQTTNAGNQTIIGGGAGSTHQLRLNSGSGSATIDHNGSTISDGSVSSGDTSLVTARYSTTGGIDTLVRVDGGTDTVDNTVYPYTDNAPIAVGVHDGGDFFNGSISEAIVYDAEVSDANLEKIESYLAIKYGLTLPRDYVNSGGTPVYETTSLAPYNQGIVGIARDDATALHQKVAHSQESGSILYMATDNDFTSSNVDISRSLLPNGTYLVAGHDGAPSTFTGVYNGSVNDRMERVWHFEETLESGLITIGIPSTTIFPAGIPVLIQSSDTTFDAQDTGSELVDDGSFFTAEINIIDGNYVSFAVEQAPTITDITRLDPLDEDTNDTEVTFEVTFSEDVQDVDTSDFETIKTGTVTGDIQSVTQVSGDTYEVTVDNVTGNGTLTIRLDASTDINDNFQIDLLSTTPTGITETYNVDTDAPSGPTITAPTTGSGVSSPTTVTGTCPGAEGGTVSLTTLPANAIVPHPTEGVVDGAGNFSLELVWKATANDTAHDIIAACTDTAGNTSVSTLLSGITPDLQGPQVQLEQSGVQVDPTGSLNAQFIATFSESINTSTFITSDLDVSTSTAPGATVDTISEIAPLDGTTFKITTSATADGDIVITLPAGQVEDVAGNLGAAALSIDNSVTIDTTPPTAPTVNSPTGGQTVNSPTNAEVVCNENDETITITNPNLVPNPTTYTCTGPGPQTVPLSWNPGTTGAQDLDVTLTDTAGNVSPATTVSILVDLDDPGVTVEQASSQADPTNVNQMTWTITFSEPINPATFTSGDLTIVSAPSAVAPNVVSLSQVAPNDDTTFELVLDTITNLDTVTVTLPVAVVTDTSGNDNTVSVSADNQITLDTTPPAAVGLTSPSDGDPSGNPTTYTGTCEPGATVTISNPNLQGDPNTFVCDGTGTFSQELLWQPGVSGVQPVDVFQTDEAGNPSPTTTVNLDVDLTTPTNPTIAFPTNGGTTDGTVSGFAEFPGTVDVVVSPGGETCTAVVQPDGSWECDVVPVPAEGPVFITATATDPAGNRSGPGSAFATIDTTPPANPTIGQPTANQPSSSPTTISGGCEPGATVTISNPNIIPDPTETTCSSGGTYSTEVTWDPGADGSTEALSVSQTDEAGNTSGLSTVDVEVDLLPPVAPSGIMASPSPASENSPTTISGVCEPGSTVTVESSNISVSPVTAICSISGTFSVSVLPTTDGNININVFQTDESGNVSPTTILNLEVLSNSSGSTSSRSGGGGGGGGGSFFSSSSTTSVKEAAPSLQSMLDNLGKEPIQKCLVRDNNMNKSYSDLATVPNYLNVLNQAQLEGSKKGYIVEGRPDGTIGLNESINRVELAKIILVSHCLPVRSVDDLPNQTYTGKSMPNFTDLPRSATDPATEWVRDVMYSAAYYEVIKGYPDGTVQPAKTVNAAEYYTMLARIADITIMKGIEPANSSLQDSWYKDSIGRLIQEGILTDKQVESIEFSKDLNRGQTFQPLSETLETRSLFK